MHRASALEDPPAMTVPTSTCGRIIGTPIMKGNAMDEKIENLNSDEVDVEALERRLELVQPGLDNGYYCYTDKAG